MKFISVKIMEATYLKRLAPESFGSQIWAVVKIGDNKTVYANVNEIGTDVGDSDTSTEYYLSFYLNLDYIKATKDEFDTFFIKTATLINQNNI